MNFACLTSLSMQHHLSVHCHQYIATHFADGPHPKRESAAAKLLWRELCPGDLVHIALQGRKERSVDKRDLGKPKLLVKNHLTYKLYLYFLIGNRKYR